MKQAFLMAVCCLFAFISKAQSPVIDIHNNRPCPIYFELYGDNGCGGSTSTGIMSIPPFTHWNGNTPVVFPWSSFTPTDFVYAVVYSGDPASCGALVISTIVGEPCGGFVMSGTLPFLDGACNPCTAAPSSFDWNPGALLIFHP